MESNVSSVTPAVMVRAAQIITFAIILGVSIFACIVMFLRRFDFGGEAELLS